jgi:hypothetical protein
VEARLHQLRGPRGTDRGHASRAGRAQALDLGAPVPARAQLLHGASRPEAQQLATYIGWLLHGTRGGIAAGGLFVLPSLFILIALSWIYVRFGNVPVVAAILYGVKPAVVAIVLAAAWAHRIAGAAPSRALDHRGRRFRRARRRERCVSRS